MEHIIKRQCKLQARLRQKKGASLVMVVIIGMALVIWVMALLPLMGVSGSQSAKIQEQEQDYLNSRSAMEYAKSELVRIVEEDPPYTFVVIDNGSNSYTAVKKRDTAGGVDPTYSTYVNADASDDGADVPVTGINGKKVAAICVVEPPSQARYNITIKTYNEGEAGMTYGTYYFMGGNLLIYPEAYQQTQALPLSDFVLVDGKLGANQVWKSNVNTTSDLHYSGYLNDAPSGSDKVFEATLREKLQPWKLSMDSSYANAGRFTSVFKTTAHASDETGGIDYSPIVETVNESWILPSTSNCTFDSVNKVVKLNGNTLSGVTVYYNGSTTVPTAPGMYQVLVDYAGSVEGGTNILPIKGLDLGTYTVNAPEKTPQSKPTCTIGTVEKVGANWQVNLSYSGTGGGTVLYGYQADSDGGVITWQPSSVITLTKAENYTFYCYQQEYMDTNGVMYEKSPISDGKRLYYYGNNKITADQIESSKSYFIVSSENLALYAASDTSLGKNTGVPIGGYSKDVYEDYYVWNVTDTGSGWMLQNDDTGKYVEIKESSTPTITYESLPSSGILGSTQNRNKITTYSWTFSGRLSDSATVFTKDSNGLYYTKSYRMKEVTPQQKRPFASWSDNGSTTCTDEPLSHYFSADAAGYVSESASTLYFIEVPEFAAPTAPGDNRPGLTLSSLYSCTKTYDGSYKVVDLKSELNSHYGTQIDTYKKVLLNGTSSTDQTVIAPGIYKITGEVEKNGFVYCVDLGTLIMNRPGFGLLGTPTVSVSGNTAEIVYTGWDPANGECYYGYRTGGVYYWYRGYQHQHQYQLTHIPAGEVTFCVAQSGTKDKQGMVIRDIATHNLGSTMTLTGADKASFVYALTGSTATWYGLPAGISPSRITMQFGKADGTWSSTYTAGETVKYGALISGTNFASDIFELNAPLPIVPAAGGYVSSYLKSSAIYLMDDDTALDTHGVTVNLHTDLLVLNHGIAGGGKVNVYPYNEGAIDIMLFAVNDAGPFKAKQFYQIPAGTDLQSVTDAQALGYLCKDGDGSEFANGTVIKHATEGDPTSAVISVEFAEKVKHLFSIGQYPYINLDIAYATNEQLGYIVSGETTGWTVDGVMSAANQTSGNNLYVVCAYVDSIAGAVSRSANRIMLASNTAITVPANATMYARYISLDTTKLVQGAAGVAFNLQNIANGDDLLNKLKEYFGSEYYNSGTLQMDYENDMQLVFADGSFLDMEAQICRYDDPTNLFAGDTAVSGKLDLMVEHSTDTITSHFRNAALAKDLVIVDRYISVINGGSDTLDTEVPFGHGATSGKQMHIYTNYLHFATGVNKVKIEQSYFGTLNDILISTQESGYTNEEYLGLFKFSMAENYNGTLMYVSQDLTVEYSKYRTIMGVPIPSKYVADTFVIPKGFYQIPAEDDGTSLLVVAEIVDTQVAANAGTEYANTAKGCDYYVDEQDLVKASVTIDPNTGEISDAYVDTGILSGEGLSAGFGGGTVK